MLIYGATILYLKLHGVMKQLQIKIIIRQGKEIKIEIGTKDGTQEEEGRKNKIIIVMKIIDNKFR